MAQGWYTIKGGTDISQRWRTWLPLWWQYRMPQGWQCKCMTHIWHIWPRDGTWGWHSYGTRMAHRKTFLYIVSRSIAPTSYSRPCRMSCLLGRNTCSSRPAAAGSRSTWDSWRASPCRGPPSTRTDPLSLRSNRRTRASLKRIKHRILF